MPIPSSTGVSPRRAGWSWPLRGLLVRGRPDSASSTRPTRVAAEAEGALPPSCRRTFPARPTRHPDPSMSDLDVLLQEHRSFPPPPPFSAHAHTAGTDIYAEASRDPDAFWARMARE